MTDQSAHFTGGIPANYDSGLGPHLFAEFAADLARRAAAAKPGRVLEIAAGTGIVTRLLRDALPGSARKTEIQRRRKAALSSGCKFYPRIGSFISESAARPLGP
jgi:hypothetical protein